MFPRTLFIVLLAVTALGCDSKEARDLKSRPARRESSAKLALPPGGTWSSAVMITASGSFERPRSGRGGIGSATVYFARTFLLLARSGGGEDELPIPSGTVESEEAKQVLELTDRKWRLSAPSDGRGVAFAPEGVEEWRWVCCDTPRPFHCSHLLLDPKGGEDPASTGPQWRYLARAMMGPADPKGLHPQAPDLYEWSVLADLVGTAESLELLDAFAGAALRETPGLYLDAVGVEALGRIQDLVAGATNVIGNPKFGPVPGKIRSSARAILDRKGLSGSVLVSNAAQLLARSKEESDLRALFEAMVREDWAPVGKVVRDMEWPRAVAWSLARCVQSRGSIPEDVESRMLAFLQGSGVKPETSLALVSALAIHGSPRMFKQLADLSNPDPDGGTQGKPDPAWPATLDELWEGGVVNHGALTHPIDAWIRAALKAKQK